MSEVACWGNLANAVVEQAVLDWRNAVTKIEDLMRTKNECEEFFLSDRFTLYSGIDGKILLEDLNKESRNERIKNMRRKHSTSGSKEEPEEEESLD